MRKRLRSAFVLGVLAFMGAAQCNERQMTSAELVASHERVRWPDSEPWFGAAVSIGSLVALVWLVTKTKETL